MATGLRAAPNFRAPTAINPPALPPLSPPKSYPSIPPSSPIHKAYMGLIGQDYNESDSPVLGWQSDVGQYSDALARILGVNLQEPYSMPDPIPITDRNTTGWEKDPEQRGYLDAETALRDLFAKDRPPPPLTLMYTDPKVKGLESYLASPEKGPVNGQWIPNESGTSLVLNLASNRGLAEGLETYAHNWENALQRYRPELYQVMRSTVGDVHGPVGRKEDYTYGEERPEEYLERWLRTATNLVSPAESFTPGERYGGGQ